MESELDPARVFTAECQAILSQIVQAGNSTGSRGVEPSPVSSKVNQVFTRAWKKFSQIHQSSPTRANNNISNRSNFHNVQKENCQKKNGSRMEQLMSAAKAINLMRLRILLCLLELCLIIFMSVVIFYVILAVHKPTQALISRHSQDLIYPLMRVLRLTTLPVIRLFPWLSEFYEEDCLITNPNYFSKSTYECWPCEDSRQVIDMTGLSNFSSIYQHGGIPFRIRQETQPYDFSVIEKIYLENIHLLSTVTLSSNVKGIRNFADVFPLNRTNVFIRHKNLHVGWKINRVAYVRYLRKYFSKPYSIPNTTEVSIQRFLFLDNHESPQYALPFTEFENVFLFQAGGRRHIVLVPTETCYKKCRVMSVVLQPGDVLFYNWLYWRPQSIPIKSSNLHTSDSISLAYVGSFY